MRGQLSLEMVLLGLLAVGAAGLLFTNVLRIATQTQSQSSRAIIYPEEPPQIVSLRCFLDHGYVIINTDRLKGTVRYRVKFINETLVRDSSATVDITTSGKVYFGAGMDRGGIYSVEFYTPKWSVSDTCTTRVHDDAIFYLPLDEGSGAATDDPANDNEAALSGYSDGAICGSNWTVGNMSYALDFNGASDYVNVTYDSSFDFDSFTVSAWLKTSAGGSPHNPLLAKLQSHDSGGGYYLRLRYGQVALMVSNGVTYGDDWGGPAVNDSQWHHVVGTRNSTHISVYVDGALAGNPTSWAGGIANPEVPLRIGRGGTVYDNSRYFDGALDDVRVYKRFLNSTEAQQLYQGTDIHNGLVGHWPFDEGSGTAAHDTHMWVAGKGGGAAHFDGTDDYVEISSNPNDDPVSPYSISFWVNFDGLYDQHHTILNKGTKSGDNHWRIMHPMGGSSIYLQVYVSGSWQTVTLKSADGTISSSKKWYHVALTSDGTTAKIYINGTLSDSSTSSYDVSLPSSSGDLILGRWVGEGYPPVLPGGNEYIGAIDDLAVYDRALSEEEVRAIYQAYEGGI